MVHIPVYERQVLDNRQLFGTGGILGDILGGDSTTTTTSATNTNTRTNALPTTETSTSLTSTSTSSTSTTTSSTSTSTSTSTTSTSSTSTSTSLTPLTTSSSVLSTTSTSAAISTSSTPEPTPITSAVPGKTVTTTSTSSSETSSPSGVIAAGSALTGSQGFWGNKAAVGVVFGIVGLVGLGLLIFIISLIVRRVRQKRLVEDAVSFNPSDLLDHRSTHNVSRMNSRSSVEKAPYYGSDSGHSNYGNGGIAPTYAATYDYNGPAYDYNNQGYGYDQGYANQGYYASQQQQGYPGYNNANPVQLPSQNMQQQNRVPSPLLPTMNQPNDEAALGSGGSAFLGQNPPGIQQVQQGASVQRAPSATGTIMENPYLSTKGFKVTNL